MATINTFQMYSFAASDFKNICDDKILVDLHRLEGLKEYDEILTFINKTFGEVSGSKHLDYPNDIKVDLYNENNMLVVYASQKGERIYGRYWQITEED